MTITSAEFRERLKRLRLNAERLRRRDRGGNRKNPALGSGLEFAGHRSYAPGDDVRFLDWNAFGRLDQLVLKVFDAPNELTVLVAMDQGATLDVGQPSKLEHLKEVGAAIGYLALSSNDRVMLAPVGGVNKRSFSSVSQDHEFLKQLDAVETRTNAQLDAWLAAVSSQRGDVLLVLLTDFQCQESTRRIIQEATHHRMRVLVLHDWTPEELAPEIEGECLVDTLSGDGSRSTKKMTVTPHLLERYHEELEKWRHAIGNFCRRLGVAHLEIRSDVSMEEIVLGLVEAGVLRVSKA